MPEFPVESPRLEMLSSGIVNEVKEWGQNAEGKRIKTEVQERDPDTGMPKYGYEVLYRGSNFGEDCTNTAVVEVGAPGKPNPLPMTPVTFEGLEVSVFINKAGGLSERWKAEAIADMQDRSKPSSTSTSNSTSSSSTTSPKSSPSNSASAA